MYRFLNLKALAFTYPRQHTETFPWPFYTLLAIATGAIFMIVLTVINVVAVGYDLVTFSSNKYNVTDPHWWDRLSKVHNYNASCQPHQFSLGDTFSTNMTTFGYTITLLEGDTTPVKRPTYGMVYYGNPLVSLCDVPRMNVTPSVFVNRQDKTVEGQIVFRCQYGFQDTEFLMSYTTSMLPIPVARVQSDSDVSVRLQRIVDSLASDLIVGIVNVSSNAAVTIDSFIVSGKVSFLPAEQPAAFPSSMLQDHGSYNMTLTESDFQAVFSNDSILDFNEGQLDRPDILNISAQNYLQLLTAAFLADIGVWNVNNILASAELLNATINPNAPIAAAIADNPGLYKWLRPLLPGAQILRAGTNYSSSPGGPIVAPAEQTQAVMALNYFCQKVQMKNALSLVIAVIVADSSMFTPCWGLFIAVSVWLAERHPSKKNSQDARCTEGASMPCSETLERRSSMARKHLSVSSSGEPPMV